MQKHSHVSQLCGLILLASLCAVGCGSASRSVCKWAEECGDVDDVGECVEKVEDGIDDEHYDYDDVVECDDCLREQGDECREGAIECAGECAAIAIEVALDL